MPEYTVHFNGYASTWVSKIQADDAESAIEKAYEEVSPFLCHQCASDRYRGTGLELADEWEATAVYDDDSGECVWTDRE